MQNASASGPVPFTEGQVQYLEEVLGVAANAYRMRAPLEVAAQDAPAPAFQVLTPLLTDAARELLVKILGSIQLNDYQIQETAEPPASPPQARHVLTFFALPPAGRARQGDVTWWNFPRLEDMLAGAPQMTELKKQTWSLLQLLNGERNG